MGDVLSKEIEERIYQEVILDDVYQIDKYQPTHVIDIGSYVGHVQRKCSGDGTEYFGFDGAVSLDIPLSTSLTHFYPWNVEHVGQLFDIYQYLSMARILRASSHYPCPQVASMLKIDIQGGEKQLMFPDENSRLFNHGAIDIIAMEWHYPSELPELLRLLSLNSFEPVVVKKHKDTMDDMETYIVIAESATYQRRVQGE